ncbi:DUF4157 domain-containing protein [Vibrio ruber]|uniref:eCIS core domain-containing protein n=1 Tax=Vibrio ruber TaxID=184755 RepID=UPI002892F707|nr:DUF4157 domain-containing protein [Vibrio ruber]WNJ96742.1 DUF4157 domain-containing protein [Vibrio ruber]
MTHAELKSKPTLSRQQAAQRQSRATLADNRQSATPVIQQQPNHTGLPDQLKSGVESLSGHAMDDVKVHYNSAKPAQLNAHAYAQGSDIHLAPGQEKHLPHEAWHVVQQKQGRVKPTMQMKSGVNINDDQGLEKEADEMGNRALAVQRQAATSMSRAQNRSVLSIDRASIQRKGRGKRSGWNDKQKAQNERLFRRRAERQQRYAQARQKEQAENEVFMQPWLTEVDDKVKELKTNKEVVRAENGNNLDRAQWDKAVDELALSLKNIHGATSNAARQGFRQKMESAWAMKEVGAVGSKRKMSTMPPKIWYTTQEIFDAKVIFLNHRYALQPGPGGGGADEDLAGTYGIDAGQKPDYLAPEHGVGDAQNVDTSDLNDAQRQALGTVTSKVASYPRAQVTVTVGVHNCPQMLLPENVQAFRDKVSHLVAKPARVYLVCGHQSVLAYKS